MSTENKELEKNKTEERPVRWPYIVVCVCLSLVLPIFLQPFLNTVFRALFTPEGWNVLQFQYRVWSMVTCMAIIYGAGFCFLKKSRSAIWLYILHFVCVVLWTGLIAAVCCLVAYDG